MDLYLFQKINSLAGQWFWLDVLGIFFAKYLGYLLIGLIFVLFWKKWRIIFQSFLAAVLAKFAIVDLIRLIWERPRPFVENNVNLLINKVNEAAFPSGHAAFFFALSTIVYFYNKKAGFLFLAGSFLISLSRVFVGVHWPSDVLVGTLIGIFTGWLVILFWRKISATVKQ